MPVWNWNKVHETGELKYLIISEDHTKEKDHQTEEMVEHWLTLYQEHIDEFGINDTFKRYMEKKKQLAAKLAEYIASGDKFKLNKINILEIDLKSLIDDKEPVRFGEIVASIEKFFGFQVDPKQLTVVKYYNYLKYIEKNIKAHGQASKR